MSLCSDCHYKNDNPDLCNSVDPPIEKPGTMKENPDDCGRYLRESHFPRMSEKSLKDFEYWKNEEYMREMAVVMKELQEKEIKEKDKK